MNSFEKKIPNSLIQKTKETVAEYNMLQERDSVLIGVSGGADSVALVHVMEEIAPIFSVKLGIAHLNHSLRGNESDTDAGFVVSLSEKLNLPCYTAKEDIIAYKKKHGLSIEEAGRRVRYSFFENIAQMEGFNKIALGHTSDDNAELILMYLIRGSGPLGISGIPPVRGVYDSKLLIIRPFIKTARFDIIKYISSNGLSHVVDKSNMDMKYLRNKIRNDLIPELKQNYNPKIVDTINRLASIMRSEDEWIENELEPVLKKCTMFEEINRIVLSISGINTLHPAVKRRIARSAIRKVKGDSRRLGYSHIELLMAQLIYDSDSWSLDLPDRIRITRAGKKLIVSKEEKNLRHLSSKRSVYNEAFFEHVINKPGLIVDEKEGFSISFSEITDMNLQDIYHAVPGTAFFDMEKIDFPLIIRNYLPGDRFTPLGMKGSQKIAKYLMNNKVPREKRIKSPVVISNGKIIWLAGFVIDNSVKVTTGTRKILKAELSLA
ncbi:MAG: tRNA lysidine(34) synthetase TilS [Desulfobacterales bacterium]